MEGKDYFLDLLFYNTQLHCYVIFELKIGEFKPEFAGKLNFYINAVDAGIKRIDDNPTVGILLCKTPNETVVRYALKGIQTAMGVSEYQIAETLPKHLKGDLPTIEELEEEIEEGYEALKTPSQKRFDALKERLAQLKGNEIKQTATTTVLFDIIDNSLLPLYKAIIKRMDDFKEWFVSSDYQWLGEKRSFTGINQIQQEWKNETFLKTRNKLNFSYHLYGLKKAGTEAFNTYFCLYFIIDTYWYGFAIEGHSIQHPFLKKLYHEQLSKEDIALITDTIVDFVTTNIERNVENL